MKFISPIGGSDGNISQCSLQSSKTRKSNEIVIEEPGMSNFQVSTPLSKKVLIFLPNLKNFYFLLRHCRDSKICVDLPSDVCRNISKARSDISTNLGVLIFLNNVNLAYFISLLTFMDTWEKFLSQSRYKITVSYTHLTLPTTPYV